MYSSQSMLSVRKHIIRIKVKLAEMGLPIYNLSAANIRCLRFMQRSQRFSYVDLSMDSICSLFNFYAPHNCLPLSSP